MLLFLTRHRSNIFITIFIIIITIGILKSVLAAINGGGESYCRGYYIGYGISQSLFLVAAIVTVILNKLLRLCMKLLTHSEAHTTLDSEQVSTISKIFVATYINTAFTVLVVFGTPPSQLGTLPSFLSNLYIFNGPYSDFSTGWYGSVGFFIITTFVLAAFGTLAVKAFKFYIAFPLYVMWTYWLIRKPTGHFIIQHQVNTRVVGTGRYSFLYINLPTY